MPLEWIYEQDAGRHVSSLQDGKGCRLYSEDVEAHDRKTETNSLPTSHQNICDGSSVRWSPYIPYNPLRSWALRRCPEWVPFAEHQQSGYSKAFLFCSSVDSIATKLLQQLFVVQSQPDMVRIGNCHTLTVLGKRLIINVVHPKVFKQSTVGRYFYIGIRKYLFDFGRCAFVVALMSPSKSSCQRIPSRINRTVCYRCSRYVENYDIFSFKLRNFYIVIRNQTCIYHVLTAHLFPECFLELFCQSVIYRIYQKLIVLFFNSKNDNASIGIGKCRICFPKLLGNPP